jgi:hypothetical protein
VLVAFHATVPQGEIQEAPGYAPLIHPLPGVLTDMHALPPLIAQNFETWPKPAIYGGYSSSRESQNVILGAKARPSRMRGEMMRKRRASSLARLVTMAVSLLGGAPA